MAHIAVKDIRDAIAKIFTSNIIEKIVMTCQTSDMRTISILENFQECPTFG